MHSSSLFSLLKSGLSFMAQYPAQSKLHTPSLAPVAVNDLVV
jgi:hypothetical protein